MKELNVKQLFTSKTFSVSGVGREGTGGGGEPPVILIIDIEIFLNMK